jgi:protein ImuA
MFTRSEPVAMSREPQDAVLARLRDEIRRIERRPARRQGFLPCGREEIDRILPGGGFPRGALAELSGGPASGKTAVALSLFAALGREELAAFVDGRGEMYPPAAAALGVDLSRLLWVRPGARPGVPGADPALGALWAAEALLGSGAFAAVAVDVPLPRRLRGAEAALRRLRAAAEKGGAVGLWLSGGETSLRVPAAIRLELEAGGRRPVARRTAGGAPVPLAGETAIRAGGGHAA